MARIFKSITPDATPAQSAFLWRVAPPVIRGAGRVAFALRVEREGDLPDPPFVIAANHYSHFDSALIGAVVGTPVRFLALDDLFGASKALEWLVLGFGAIPTPRARPPVSAVRTALVALEKGDVVGVFPEATRVTHWGVLPPKRGAAWLAIRAGVPLVPVAVLGTGRAFGIENRLRPAKLRVVIGQAIRPDAQSGVELTNRWAGWMTRQVERFPTLEPPGPPRAGTV